MWEAYENLQARSIAPGRGIEPELDRLIEKLVREFDEFMNDDFNTAKVMANMFEIVPVINSMKDKTIPVSRCRKKPLNNCSSRQIYVEDILGLQRVSEADNEKLQGVMQLLIDIRKEAKQKRFCHL